MTYFGDPGNQDYIERLKELGLNMKMLGTAASNENHPFYGKTMVFTGTLPTLDRATAQTMAQEVGAKVTSSVSKKTDYVVAGPIQAANIPKPSPWVSPSLMKLPSGGSWKIRTCNKPDKKAAEKEELFLRSFSYWIQPAK